jgi:hypothetical protein
MTTAWRGSRQLMTSDHRATPTACVPSVAKPCRVSKLWAATTRPHAGEPQNSRQLPAPALASAPLGPAAAPLAARASSAGEGMGGSWPRVARADRMSASFARMSSVVTTWGDGRR